MSSTPYKETTPSSALDVLAIRDFRLYEMARLFAITALAMQSVAVGWQVYALTHRPLDLGYTGLVQFLPSVALVLFTGQVADRYDRRKIVMLCYALGLCCALALWWLAGQSLTTPLPIFATLLVLGVARAFEGPAETSMLPHLVPREQMSRALALGMAVWNLSVIIGPAVGGVVLAWAGHVRVVYGLCAALVAMALVCMASLHVRPGRQMAQPMDWANLLAGLRFVFGRKIILGAISLDLFAVLLGGSVALLPIFARDILHVGPRGMGLLRSAPAAGAGLMALMLVWQPLKRRVGRKMFVGVVLFGLCTVVFGLSRNFWLSLGVLGVLGAADMLSVVVRHTLVQTRTPLHLLGRVGTVNMLFIGASNELGEFESGLTAQWWGAPTAVLVGGIGTLLVALLWAWLFRELRQANRFEEEPAAVG